MPDPHLHYAKVLQTRTRRGVFRLCFRFAMVEDDLQKVLTFSVTQLFGRMKSIHPSVIRSMTAYSLSRILPLLGGCILSKGMYIGSGMLDTLNYTWIGELEVLFLKVREKANFIR